jgi:CBS domain-containing protein
MTTLRDLVKDRKVYSVEATRTVLEAARYMMEHNVGAVPVLRNGELVGILSERDIMNRVVAVGRTPGTTAVSEVMTANPRAVAADESIEECLFVMREFGFRH